MPEPMEVTEDNKEEEKKESTPEEIDALTCGDITMNIRHIEKAVSTKEARLVHRGLKNFYTLRKKLNENVLQKIVSEHIQSATARVGLSDFISGSGAMETGDSDSTGSDTTLPEVRTYIHVLIVVYLIDQKKANEACECAAGLIDAVRAVNQHTLHPLTAKAFFYYARTQELMGKLGEVRGNLLALHRTACLRHDELGQAVLLNALLRSFLSQNLVDQADKLSLKATFPENASNNETARHLYYLGRIRSIQLSYTEAHNLLMKAIRKAPEQCAFGFKITAYKLATIVQLLNGEVPERALFFSDAYKEAMAPYFALCQAVRHGDLKSFNSLMEKNRAGFVRDETYMLILRLRHNVVKTGLRKICVSYARISLADIASKLSLESAEDAEFVVAKAIRDGVVDAVIDYEGKFVRSKETLDVYSTDEPQEFFSQRTNFCLNLHNDAVKALRFPENKKPKIESMEDRLEREKEEKELLEEVLEEDEDEF